MSYHHHHMDNNVIILMFVYIFISTLSTVKSTTTTTTTTSLQNNKFFLLNDDGGGGGKRHPHHHDDQRLQFIVEPETIWAASADGRRITFKCQVSPSDAHIRWLLNGTILTENDSDDNFDWIKISENKLSIKLQKSNNNDLPSSSSSIDSQQQQRQRSQMMMMMTNLQGAVFQCLAEWNNQVIVSQPAKLIIAELMPFDQDQESIINMTAIAGNNVIIPCNLPHSIPLAVAEFEFNHNVTITANNISHDRYRILPSGQLLIQNVRPFDSGVYRCIAHNPFLQEKMYANHFVQLKVMKPKHSPNELKPLRFMLQPKTQMTVILGSNITFECVAHGYPIPKIMWTKIDGNGELPKQRTFITNGVMVITTVQKQDEGIYSCSASNSKSSLEANTELKVYEMPEIIQDEYETIEMESGQNYDLHCDARGEPRPLISWLHNGYFIDSQITNDVFFEQDGSLLKIIGASPQLHQGIYQCFATNELGTTYAIKVIQFKSLNNYHHHHHNQQVSSTHHHHRFVDSHLNENNPSIMDPSITDGYEQPDFLDNTNYRPNDNDDDDNGQGGQGEESKNHDHQNQPHPHHHNHHHHHSKKKHGKFGKDLKLIPPSRPEISKLNDDSVMVRWHVPKSTGLPIQFFKVQYKELGHGDWNTVDIDIPAHIFSYPVCCLNPNSTYRFRIAAVYSNDDNKNGKSSNKFVFQKDPQMKRPTMPPTILNATSISPEEIVVQWEHLNIDQQPVDGFFINYRATDSAGQYLMVTSVGATSRSQNIPHLKPNTAYEIKMQCFNDAGTSDFSNIYTVKTIASSSLTKDSKDEISNERPRLLPPSTNGIDDDNKTNDDDYGDFVFGIKMMKPKWLTRDQYWLAIVIIIITMALFIISCSIICCLRQKTSKNSGATNTACNTTTTMDGTKLKLENNSNHNHHPHHNYFTAINGLLQEQNRRLSATKPSSVSVIANGHNHHNSTASGLLMLKSVGNGSQHNINNNNKNHHHHQSTDDDETTTDSACSIMNRRNSFRNSTALSYSSNHLLYNNSNDQKRVDNKNHHQTEQQQQNNHQTATIDRKRPLKNSIPGSYLLEPSIPPSSSPSTLSSSNNNHNNDNGGVITRNQHHHHHSSFTRLNGTLERKRRSRHDLTTAILMNGNGNGVGQFYNSRTNISSNGGGSTIDMYNSSHHHRQQQQQQQQQQYSNGNNSSYFHSNGGGNNFVIMQSSC
ncbi:brother of CDO [Dermatophagoides farinae]|uniref:brother of CDO n=1 Tax=Dermatophagoides farinae TaxID=6954 RepID=UPI003F63D027